MESAKIWVKNLKFQFFSAVQKKIKIYKKNAFFFNFFLNLGIWKNIIFFNPFSSTFFLQ
jgi:hypothetical protein